MQNSPGSPALDGLAGGGVDDLDLDVGVHPADGRRTPLEVVVGAGLARDRAGLGHPVGDRGLLHVHLVDAALHHLDRADRAGHDPGAQGGFARSWSANDGWCCMAMNIVGTPYTAVQRSWLIASRVMPGSKPGAGMTIVAPWLVQPRLAITIPKQW